MRPISSFVFLFFVSMMTMLSTGCYYDKEETLYPGSGTISCTGVTAKFKTDVSPIMVNKCATAGCHNAAAAAGGTVLESYTQVAAKVSRINQRCIVEKNMPVDGPLNTSEIATLKCWIESGSPDN